MNKSIAEQIFDAIGRSRAVVDGGSYPKQEYCEQIAKECIENKKDLIEILSHHPNWDAENYRVHFNNDYIRISNVEKAATNLIYAMSVIIDHLDNILRVEYIDDETLQKIKLKYLARYISDRPNFFTVEAITQDTVDDLKNTIYAIAVSGTEPLTISFPDACIHRGSKGTKQVMRLLRQYGFNTLPEEVQHRFFQEYSKFSDYMNPITITRHTVLSVNPIDFLYMSVGNSWSSCHNILEGRCHCGGCESYAYDSVSMIFYTVDANTPDEMITFAPKINRQMNFYNGDGLLSVRVYPQSCDGDESMYNECKSIVQKIIADCKNAPNIWKSTDWISYSEGHQYPDYDRFGPYKSYRLSDTPLHNRNSWTGLKPITNNDTGEIEDYRTIFNIGSDDAICACCGGKLDTDEAPICNDCIEYSDYYCYNCGSRIMEGEEFSEGDYFYCESCHHELFRYCECCEEYFRSEDGYWIESENQYVCPECFDYYYGECDNCGDIYRKEDMRKLPDGGYVCDDCFNDDYEECIDCGDIHLTADMYQLANGDWICRDCMISGEYIHCDECGELYHINDTKELKTGENICESCLEHEDKYDFCRECGAWVSREDDDGAVVDGALNYVCRDCLDKLYEIKYVRKVNIDSVKSESIV